MSTTESAPTPAAVADADPDTPQTNLEPAPTSTSDGPATDTTSPSGADSPQDAAASRADSVDREQSPAISEGSTEELGTSKAPGKESGSTSTKTKRKEAKGIEHVLKALNSLESTEEKLAALCTKYTELLEEHRLLQNKTKQNQRKLNTLTREKEQLQTEQSKTVLAKSKLENLCRELQRHNKLIKDESIARTKEEEEKRKEVTSKFQITINDIQRQMNENHEKNSKLRDENVELATKLKNLIEQYELREQHIEKVIKHKELEQQLIDAKLAQANLQMTEEKEKTIREKQLLLDQVGHSNQKIEVMEAQEKHLRSQVAMYTDKYEEFQTTLTKSNEVFQSFKSEMEKMTKKIKKLEKETTMWRSRWENSNKALLDMAEDKTRSDREILLLNSKVQKLESLCRALQEERKKVAATKPTSTSQPASTPTANTEKVEPTESSANSSPVTVQNDSQSQPDSASPPTDQSQATVQPQAVNGQSDAALKPEDQSQPPVTSKETDTETDTVAAEENVEK